jgi:ribosomal protein S18 acetylase RimI-like enzyme
LELEIKKVTEKDRKDVLDYLYNDDPFLNAYAISRLQNKILGQVETYFATNNSGSNINGYLSTFEGLGRAADIWIRGKTLEIEQRLLDFFRIEILPVKGMTKLFISTNVRMSSAIKERFPTGKIDSQTAMLVRKGEEEVSKTNDKVVTVHEELAEEWTRFVLPEGWEVTEQIIENNRKFLKEYAAFGIMDSNGKIVSVASSFVWLPHVTVISGVETHPIHRRKGYATAVVSAALKDALIRSQSAFLFVNQDNYDAIRVYERLGFRKIGECIAAEIEEMSDKSLDD